MVRQNHPELELGVFDICEDAFPQAEVWHCRDCLFHLPFADIRKAFENFARSDIAFALLTTHRARLLHRNLDVTPGGFRFLDLERPPFNFPPPEEYLADYWKDRDFPRFMALWPRDAVTGVLRRWPV